MHDGIDELDDLMQRAGATPWGKTCSALWAQAAVLAEERGDLEKAVRCYGELCAAYMMGGESTRVVAPFMWLDRIYKSRPELFEEQDVTALGWYYKYVISTVRCVPTVPVSQCEALLDEMYSYYAQMGDSMRAYHIRSYLFHRDMGELDKAEDSYAKWESAEHSELSDCERCDPGYEVGYYTRQGRWIEAVAAGDKALAVEGDFCDSQPEALLTQMLVPWLHVGRDSEAWAAHIRAYRRYQQAPRYFEYLQDHFSYLALSGRAGRADRLERGLTILIRHMPWWKEAEHPRVLMDTAAAVFVLLDSFEGADRQRVLPLTLPGEDLPWAPRESVENPTIERAAEWMRALALDIAGQFAQRPGNRAPNAELERVQRALNPVVPPPLPSEDGLKDVTGLGEYRSSMTLSVAPVAESVVASSTGFGAPVVADSDEDDEAPLVPLSASGDWLGMAPVELLETSWRIAKHSETIYSLQLGVYLRRHPEEVDAFIAGLPEELEVAGRWISHTLTAGESLSYESWDDSGQARSDDAAISLVIEAQRILEQGNAMEAAQLADQAMRMPSADPHGVRITALALLGSAAERAGYFDEAIESYRDATNLCALLGFKVDQAILACLLAGVLGKKRRWVESAEVAQNALDLLDEFPQVWAYRVRLLNVAAHANQQLKYGDAAGAYHFEAAQLLNDHGELESARAAFFEAAEAFSEAHAFVRAIDSHAASVPLMEQLVAGALLELELADSSDEAALAELKARVKALHLQYAAALYSYARSIVMQPGNVPDADIALMEQVMDKLRVLVTDPGVDEYFSQRGVQWRHADWLSDIAYMHWQAYQYSIAVDEQRASIAEFEKLDDVEALAERVLSLAFMLGVRQETSEARACAQRVLELLDAPRFAGNSTKRQARQFLKDLDSAQN